MLPKYPNFQYFLDTLCHEMVHLYQMQNLGDTGNHNKLFWSFEKKAQRPSRFINITKVRGKLYNEKDKRTRPSS